MTAAAAGDPLAGAPVGVFDSGIGGLSVWREIRRHLPSVSTIYLADQAELPYGPKSAEHVRERTRAASRLLQGEGCRAIVIACNTASAAALHEMRAEHPDLPFVGMEPAVKPAAERSRSRVVGVMATPGTLQGKMFAEAVARFAEGVTVINQPCTGLVERIETQGPQHPGTVALVRELVSPFAKGGADSVVLACTHFAFVAGSIRQALGPEVDVIDPAPAIARQLGRVLGETGAGIGTSSHRFLTTGDAARFAAALKTLTGVDAPVDRIRLG